jgi:hypothetical protein
VSIDDQVQPGVLYNGIGISVSSFGYYKADHIGLTGAPYFIGVTAGTLEGTDRPASFTISQSGVIPPGTSSRYAAARRHSPRGIGTEGTLIRKCPPRPLVFSTTRTGPVAAIMSAWAFPGINTISVDYEISDARSPVLRMSPRVSLTRLASPLTRLSPTAGRPIVSVRPAPCSRARAKRRR